MKRLIIICLTIFVLGIPLLSSAESLNLCVDDRYWYPYTFTDSAGKPKGMHIDLVLKALEELGYQATIKAYPKMRCIYMTKANEVDGMISISYDKSLDQSFTYPPGDNNEKESPFKIMQVDHLVITYKDDPYVYNGDMSTLPSPIRIPFGETVVDSLQKTGLAIQKVKTDEQNFLKMIRDKNGCVITTSIIAEKFNQNDKFAGKFKIQATPLTSQPYFLTFSPKSKLSADKQKKIWEEIAKWRDDYVFTLVMYSQY